MKVLLTRQKVLKFHQVLNEFLTTGGQQEYKLNYGIIKNKDKLEKECVDINIQLNLFDLERVDLCEKHCEKDEEGKPIIDQNNYKGLDHHKDFKKEFDELKENIKEYKNVEVEIEAFVIDSALVPDQMIGKFQEAIMPFIGQPEKKKKNEKDKEVKIN